MYVLELGNKKAYQFSLKARGNSHGDVDCDDKGFLGRSDKAGSKTTIIGNRPTAMFLSF